MTIDSARFFSALELRLESITAANGYPLTVKKVERNLKNLLLDQPYTHCPMVEIIDGPERPDGLPKMGGQIDHVQEVFLRLVAPHKWSDSQMQEFQSCVIRCIYANGWNESSNGGVQFSDADGVPSIVHPRWIATEKDYGMIESNRIWSMRWVFKSNRWTYRF